MSIGYLLSNIGSGLTQLVIFGELATAHAPPIHFAFAYFFATAASLVALTVGGHAVKRLDPYTVLALCEILGLLGVMLPARAVEIGSIWLLTASTLVPSAAVALGVPAYGLIVKRGFSSHEFSVVAAIESVTLSATVLLGPGLGTLLYPFVPHPIYLLIDAITYFCAGGLILMSRQAARKELRMPAFPQMSCSPHPQAKIYPLVPLVATFTAPAIALLPAIGAALGSAPLLGHPLNAALILLFARGISQVVGPLVVPKRHVDSLYARPIAMLVVALIFAITYALAFSTENIALASGAVLVAHVLAYALTATAQTGMFQQIPESDIVSSSTRTYQIQLIFVCSLSLTAGFLADWMSPRDAFLLISSGTLLTAGLWLIRNCLKSTSIARQQ